MTNQLAKTDGGLKSLLSKENVTAQIAKALPSHLKTDRFVRVAITALSRVPKLQDCTPESFMKCLLDLSAMGLEPDGRRAYLIPYGKECTLIISYMGLVELMRNSGEVASIRAETVCEKDAFEWVNGEVKHSINWREDRGAVQAVYAEAKLKTGEVQTATMTKAEVENIRKRSKAGNSGPWQTDWAEMAKKTAVRRLSKMMPLSAEIREAIEKDDHQFQPIRDVTPRMDVNPFAETQEQPTEEGEE